MQNPYLAEYAAERQYRAADTVRRARTGAARSADTVRKARTGAARPADTGRGATSGRHHAAARARRRRIVRRRRMAVALLILGVTAAGVWLLSDRNRVTVAAESRLTESETKEERKKQEAFDGGELVQGLSRADFDRHPEWTEDFLTPNEYSRPGEPLEEVKSIFVHYTANPGTSAAQNRSYFEQQKDMHQASVSAHFIIGYEGEILQCLPLDEIGYAVQTRNFDSISIECCYKAKDGSFTQETYDSLISLLAWLTDVYDLDTEDILRHYDCGGKKCPLYYTENPDSWERLKKDVEKIKL